MNEDIKAKFKNNYMGMHESQIFVVHNKIENLTDEAQAAFQETLTERNIDINKLKKTLHEEDFALEKTARIKQNKETEQATKSTKYWLIVTVVILFFGALIQPNQTYITAVSGLTQVAILAAISGLIFALKKWPRKKRSSSIEK
ncbi:MAG: hypothetical protein PHE96_06055 [Methylococcales bacterium]|nr:hypothetical protein [Methylococcales bacterium]